jgi:hypothetical protein
MLPPQRHHHISPEALMFRSALLFACLLVSCAGTSSVAIAQETCSQAANRCVRNCTTGYAVSETAKNRCVADCGGRRNECLMSGRWRQSNPAFQDRFNLIKK